MMDDEHFNTVPDCGLNSVAVPADTDGCIRFSGVIDTAEREAPKTIELPMPTATVDSIGRLLEVQHTLLRLSQLKVVHYDPTEATKICTEIACAAGLASEYTTLLTLSLPEQFADNDLKCPDGHSAHAAWKVLVAKREADKAAIRKRAEERTAQKLKGLVAPMVTRYDTMVKAKVQNWGVKKSAMQSGQARGRGGIPGGAMRSAPMSAMNESAMNDVMDSACGCAELSMPSAPAAALSSAPRRGASGASLMSRAANLTYRGLSAAALSRTTIDSVADMEEETMCAAPCFRSLSAGNPRSVQNPIYRGQLVEEGGWEEEDEDLMEELEAMEDENLLTAHGLDMPDMPACAAMPVAFPDASAATGPLSAEEEELMQLEAAMGMGDNSMPMRGEAYGERATMRRRMEEELRCGGLGDSSTFASSTRSMPSAASAASAAA